MRAATTALPLVPLPASLRVHDGEPFRLDETVRITGDPAAAGALHRLLATRTGLHLTRTDATPPGPRIDLEIAGAGVPESYSIEVGGDGVRVRGADAAGVFYAVQTFGQLVAGGSAGWVLPRVRIDDAPRFGYRGVMLDVARHFHGPATVAAYVERAASLKLNVLHLHLSDDQAWRLELTRRPELTARASAGAVDGDPGGFYTQDEYRAIVTHAAAHHMTVVPEFDVPGHTHAVGLAYPEIAADPVPGALQDGGQDGAPATGNARPVAGEAYHGTGVGFSSLRIGEQATDAFVADVFGELAELTPGPYVHFGGDEAHGTDPADFASFVADVSRVIAGLGKTPIAWHEAGIAPGLAAGTVGQYWSFVVPRDDADLRARAFAAGGGKVILSPADAIYLDIKPDAAASLGLTWTGGPTSIERSYSWEPSDVVPDLAEADILGIEAPLWTETVRDLDDIDALAFPRVAAAAEAAWSPATGTSADRTWTSFRTRVGGLGPLWTTLGIRFPASEEIPWTS